MSAPMTFDCYSELFDCCRNACIPGQKLIEGLKDQQRKRPITSTKESELEEWYDSMGAAFIFIDFNVSLMRLEKSELDSKRNYLGSECKNRFEFGFTCGLHEQIDIVSERCKTKMKIQIGHVSAG